MCGKEELREKPANQIHLEVWPLNGRACQSLVLSVYDPHAALLYNIVARCVHDLGKWNKTVDVAVKTLKPGSMSGEAFLEEAKIMHRLRHRKLVLLMGVYTKEEPFYIITELMSHGSLLEYIRDDSGRTIRMPILIDMAAQVGGG